LKQLNYSIFLPPFLLLLISVILSIFFTEGFLKYVKQLNQWILQYFDWLFSWSTFLLVFILVITYFSPIAKLKIGGKDALPLLTKWQWFSITLCTTIATGILFWGTAEPIYHLNGTPEMLNIADGSKDAAHFAMSTMYMHWTITPYSIYTVAALVFALSFYNLKQPFNIRALLFPAFNKQGNYAWLNIVNVLCLFALVAGMAASLGTGILTISGGLNSLFSFTQTTFLNFIIAATIVIAFSISASTGLLKGIKFLSVLNIRAFIGLAIFIAITGPTIEMIKLGFSGFEEYVSTFFQRSTNLGSNINTEWQQSWTVFYWANWLAWTPVTALFLGRIAKGYTVKQFIKFNLILPSIFSGFWMTVFSGTALNFDTLKPAGMLNTVLQTDGPQNVIYTILEQLPFSAIVSTIFLVIIFISFVTAADSNTSALSSISTKNLTTNNTEGAAIVKYLWGFIIGALAFVMISFSGIEGVKILSTIGGFPILFLMIVVAYGLLKMVFVKSYFERLAC